MSQPPDAFFGLVRERDREAARTFYKKCVTAEGMPIVAAEVVDDRALLRTREIVSRMLDYDPDLYALVHETFAYGGKVDWRLGR